MSSPRLACLVVLIVVGVEVAVGIPAIHGLAIANRDAAQAYLRLVQSRPGIARLQSQAQETHLSALYALRMAPFRRSAIELAAGLTYALLFGSVAIWVTRRDQTRRAAHLAKRHMDFVAFVSHELRTPMLAILTAGENVRDGFVGSREELTEQGSIIVDQASRMQELVDEVLVFAEITNNKPLHAVRVLAVSEVLESVLENTAMLIRQSGFTVETKLQPGLPQFVGDLSVISRCLENFMANAVKYSDKERWICLSAKVDEVSPDRKEIQISVHDHGIGIPSSDLPNIFEPFYRSSRVVTAQIRGSGLGLAIAKRSADAMGARLSVNSEVDRGSIFTLHLPIAHENVAQESAFLADQELSP